MEGKLIMFRESDQNLKTNSITLDDWRSSFDKCKTCGRVGPHLCLGFKFDEDKTHTFDASKFQKLDLGKPMMSLVEPNFVRGLAEVLTFGAKKYAPNNWKLAVNETDRIKDAMLRHIYAYLSGEECDPESNLPHLHHAAFGLMTLGYFDEQKKKGNKTE